MVDYRGPLSIRDAALLASLRPSEFHPLGFGCGDTCHLALRSYFCLISRDNEIHLALAQIVEQRGESLGGAAETV